MGRSTEDTFPGGFRNQARVPFQLVILGLPQVAGWTSRSTPLTHRKTLESRHCCGQLTHKHTRKWEMRVAGPVAVNVASFLFY